ncbi:glycosyltransferase [Pontibacter sp. JH31]|uniref:Glycosyltransferase n=1 Tax=Pontibacter aquaedesilientis TaxID=2766980 RepID=A0ABR7XHP6_9BACT|nr:glycosyltransferase [Pontibacter aquaedesilientis]MBD1396956.1 glycosyltransferase [Pontibacter aquaedesilientis]
MKIRVLYVQETISSGGVERRRHSLAKLLPKEIFEIKIICTQVIGPLASDISKEGVEIIEIGLLGKIWNLSKYKAVLKVIKSYKPHIIHGAVFEGVLLATIAGRLGKVPIVIAEETSDPKTRSKKADKLLKGLSLLADAFVGVSPAAYDYLLSRARVSPNKLRLIVNGVFPPQQVNQELISNLRMSLNISQGDFVIGSVGRLFNKVKLFTDLVDAIALLRDRFENIKLVIVGDGPDKHYLETYISELGLESHIILVGFQYDPHPYFKIMDVFGIVSSTESFGLVVVEAMYHKLPVIASKIGGLKDIVEDGKTGILVDVNSPEQIAEALIELMSDPLKMKEMGETGFTNAYAKYSAERYVKDVESLYDELLIRKRII